MFSLQEKLATVGNPNYVNSCKMFYAFAANFALAPFTTTVKIVNSYINDVMVTGNNCVEFSVPEMHTVRSLYRFI